MNNHKYLNESAREARARRVRYKERLMRRVRMNVLRETGNRVEFIGIDCMDWDDCERKMKGWGGYTLTQKDKIEDSLGASHSQKDEHRIQEFADGISKVIVRDGVPTDGVHVVLFGYILPDFFPRGKYKEHDEDTGRLTLTGVEAGFWMANKRDKCYQDYAERVEETSSAEVIEELDEVKKQWKALNGGGESEELDTVKHKLKTLWIKHMRHFLMDEHFILPEKSSKETD